jgi:hypothetical protein
LKVIVFGLSPSTKGGKSKSLTKLKLWLDYIDLQYVSFDNIFWTPGETVNAKWIEEISKNYDKIVALGVATGSVLSCLGIDHYTLPHPSGLNRKLNDSEYVNQKLNKCKEYLWN